jgi:hypothetical protein
MTGLLTGIWKYYHIHNTQRAQAPTYVDIAHRASLMYSFAAIVLAEFVKLSAWSEQVNFWAVAAPIVFFALAITTYVIHGVLGDTDNQFKKPHKLGSFTLPAWIITGFMVLLILAEVGGFAVLFAGFLITVF